MQEDKESKNNRLKRTCAEFESIFIELLLKSMRRTVDEGGIVGGTNEDKIFKSMLDENLALGISRAGGIGLGEVLFKQFRH